jgi:AraC-like DNA-binding protein
MNGKDNLVSTLEKAAIVEMARLGGWRVGALAMKWNCSVRKLERRFRAATGMGAKGWLTVERHRLAAKMLRDGFLTKQVAGEVGYRLPHHFSRAFKKVHGMSPSQFRKQFAPPRIRTLGKT